jgi:hypothetical protein
MASQAHAEAATAFTTLAGETATTNLTGQDLGGMTLNPIQLKVFCGDLAADKDVAPTYRIKFRSPNSCQR